MTPNGSAGPDRSNPSAGIGSIVLTQGRRPDALAAALDSLAAQDGVELDIVVVGNGWQPSGLPKGVKSVALDVDQGIPAGRNAGVPAVAGELLFFLDDDARLAAPDALAKVAARFAADPALGMLQLRVRASDGGPAPRDWVPRLRVGDPARSSEATAVWEGAVAVRRTVFEQAGGWPEEFRFVHEGIDLAWRVMDTGRRVVYAGDIEVLHPSYRTAPHGYSAYYGARNRVFLARRNLPLPVGTLYVAGFALRTLPLLLRSPGRVRPALRGYRDGLRQPCGVRRRLRAGTIWRMTRAGRPPIL
jgi:GT2 family glycosyltransferase